MLEPFSEAFNAIVETIAGRLFPNGFSVRLDMEDCPSNLIELNKQVELSDGVYAVWAGGSLSTIFGDENAAHVNHQFRAWHDRTHYNLQADFTLSGEARVAEAMVHDVAVAFGRQTADEAAPLIYAEIIGQALYYRLRNEFPAEQRAFTEAFLWALRPQR